MKTVEFNEKEVKGCVSVDSGLVMVGDPCYTIHKSITAPKDYDRLPKAFGKSWDDFCTNTLHKAGKHFDRAYLEHDSGAAGLAFIEGNFGGDGLYPVYEITDKNGRVKQLIIDFDAE